ncbi:MAG: response regulator [Verrucomicrobia bacterium]|nr:response regulator [Verrucomicrobiota bacterium]
MPLASPTSPAEFVLERLPFLRGLHRWLVTPPPGLPERQRDFYALSNCTHVLGLVSHVLFFLIFVWLELSLLAFANIGSICIFALTLTLSKRGKLDAALLIGGLEVGGHQTLAALSLGLAPQFQHYILILAVGTLFYRHLPLERRVGMAIIPVLGYIIMNLQGLRHRPWYQIDGFAIDLLATMNITFFVVILMGMCIYFQYYVEEARILAEKLAQSKTLFLANMSHELRTPLNAILGFAQILQRSEALTEQDRRNVETINRSGGHLLELINDILDMSKLEEGKLDLELGAFDLHRLLEDLEGMFALAARRKQLAFRIERAPDVPRVVRSDELRLRQVLINLTGNALKFTERGSVTVQVACAPDGPDGRPSLVFHVRDTGRGIARSEVGDLFQLFTQTEAGRHSRRGTGLGLALSQKFIQLLGGRIQVESELGHGSTFWFTLPVELVADETAVPAGLPRRASRVQPEGRGRKMLVVDDSAENREVLLQFLRGLGFTAESANDGAEGVAKWRAWQPDLVWMDLRMPVMDGYEACRRICDAAAEAGQPRPPVVAITASSLEGGRILGEDAGFSAYAPKPFRAVDLCALIERLLQVKFEDSAPPEAAPAAPAEDELRRELAALAPAERDALLHAATVADFEAAEHLIRRISEAHPAAGAALQEQLDAYRFDRIQSLLQPG